VVIYSRIIYRVRILGRSLWSLKPYQSYLLQRRAYQEINEFEEDLANYGTVICKFWLQISRKEQIKRFKERQKIDYKRWKITEEDWRNREKWDAYEEAVLDMLERTSTTYAPWTIVEGEDKNWARIKTLKTVCEAIERRLKKS
jgi:AMP-polyphosphate phosphotransferase